MQNTTTTIKIHAHPVTITTMEVVVERHLINTVPRDAVSSVDTIIDTDKGDLTIVVDTASRVYLDYVNAVHEALHRIDDTAVMAAISVHDEDMSVVETSFNDDKNYFEQCFRSTLEMYDISDEIKWRAIELAEEFYDEEYDNAENVDNLLDELHSVVEPLAKDGPVTITIDEDADRGCTFLFITSPEINDDTVLEDTVEAISELENQLVFEMPSALIDELRERAQGNVVIHRPTSG